MPQKLTLARYLEGRGSVKSLTRIEAEAFGVPYPLVSGWPGRYGDMEITQAMIEELSQRIGCAPRSTASKALRGLEGAVGQVAAHPQDRLTANCKLGCISLVVSHAVAGSSFPGFTLRPAKRARLRLA